MRKGIFGGLLVLFLVLSGCDNSEEFSRSPHENFEALWKILDEHYCFFEYKEIDWDEVYSRYYEQVSDTMNQYVLFDLLGKMMRELKDGHTNLISSFNVARYWAWYEDYPVNFFTEIQRNYLGTDYQIAGGLKYKIFEESGIGYIHYSSFSSGVGDANLDYVFYHFKDCKAIIFDIRDNGGGALTNSDRIAARFLEEKILTGYIQHKTGKGHGDFSEPHPLYLSPSDRVQWLRPVALLTNRHCYSAANDFTQKMKLMPYVTVIGDRTGGGSGFPFSSELPIGWSVRFSSSPLLDVNKQHTEFGIDPDIHVDMTAQDLADGKDTIIETAIAYLLSLYETEEAGGRELIE